MPKLFSNLRECKGFSQIMKSTKFKIFLARVVMSSKSPIGVDMIYKPFSKLFILITFIFILACTPENNFSNNGLLLKNPPKEIEEKNINKIILEKKNKKVFNNLLINEVELILPLYSNQIVNKNLINSFELSIYKNKIKNTKMNINRYASLVELRKIVKEKIKPGKIFVGTLASDESEIVKEFCSEGILFFSFSSDISLAGECVYLINFFPRDDLIALFNFFPPGSRIAILYPQNNYGENVNKIINEIASNSKSLIINRASYKEDLTDARIAIKELRKYEFRKLELERQKEILSGKQDEVSQRALKKIQKLETIGNVEFTHLILPDYSIRLLEIAPLLPFYDVDPQKVQFVGTGVWDDKAFFDEPSLQNSIFSGIEETNRKIFFNDYEYIYKEKPIRTATIPYDLMAIISLLMEKNLTISQAYNFLNNGNIKFDGIDGKFIFSKNIISRELDILKIKQGEAKKIN